MTRDQRTALEQLRDEIGRSPVVADGNNIPDGETSSVTPASHFSTGRPSQTGTREAGFAYLGICGAVFSVLVALILVVVAWVFKRHEAAPPVAISVREVLATDANRVGVLNKTNQKDSVPVWRSVGGIAPPPRVLNYTVHHAVRQVALDHMSRVYVFGNYGAKLNCNGGVIGWQAVANEPLGVYADELCGHRPSIDDPGPAILQAIRNSAGGNATDNDVTDDKPGPVRIEHRQFVRPALLLNGAQAVQRDSSGPKGSTSQGYVDERRRLEPLIVGLRFTVGLWGLWWGKSKIVRGNRTDRQAGRIALAVGLFSLLLPW